MLSPSSSPRARCHLGLSEVSAETVRRAHAVHPITAVQSEYSLWTRTMADEVLPTMREPGIGLVTYSPLGHGFLTGAITSDADVEALADGDWRKTTPRFTGDNLTRNRQLAAVVRDVSQPLGASSWAGRAHDARRPSGGLR